MPIKTSQEETSTSPHFEYTIPLGECQEVKLQSNNTIQDTAAQIEIYSHCFRFFRATPEKSLKPHKQGSRGKISHFSKRSRFRLFELLSMIDSKLDHKPLFVSLTYHHGHQNSKTSTKSHLHNFLTRLRDYDPDVQFIWRTELQSRGAPHYHLIIFPAATDQPFDQAKYGIKISCIWHEIADPGSRKHKDYGCKLVVIESYREACSYLSKYVAKQELNNIDIIEGKHWGCSRKLPIKCHEIIKMNNDQSRKMCIAIRKWLCKNGKAKYADPDYIHIHLDFTVFIDQNKIDELFLEIANLTQADLALIDYR